MNHRKKQIGMIKTNDQYFNAYFFSGFYWFIMIFSQEIKQTFQVLKT